jgi:hypothetical protein
MLLHAHPVNEQREARGALPVNGVWLWGGGRLSPARSPGLRSVVADEPLARGLASSTDVHGSHVPQDPRRWLELADADGVHLIVLNGLQQARRQGAPERWVAAVEALERDWCEPLAQALLSGRVGMVSLHVSSDRGVLNTETTRSDLRHFWRRRQPLVRYAQPV